jgi:hypothetical protein
MSRSLLQKRQKVGGRKPDPYKGKHSKKVKQVFSFDKLAEI